MAFLEGRYLLNLDGTGYYSSEKIGSEACLTKVDKKTGKVMYYQGLYCILHLLRIFILHEILKPCLE